MHCTAQIAIDQKAAREIALFAIAVGRAGVADLPAIRIEPGDRDPRTEGIAERTTDIGIAFNLVEPAKADIAAGCKDLGRLSRDVVDRTTGRVLPEQRALWAFEHFDAFKVISRMAGQHRKRQRRLIDIDTDRGIDAQRAFVEADAAQGQDRCVVDAGGKGQPGHDCGNILQRGDLALVKVFARQHRHGQADLVQPFLTLVGGDDDFARLVVAVRVGSGFGRRCGRGRRLRDCR